MEEQGWFGLRFRNDKLVAYSFDHLLKLGFLYPRAALSLRVLFFVLVFTALGTLYALGVCNRRSVSYYGSNFCFIQIAVEKGLYFQALLAFLLGMLTTSSYQRWWNQRLLLQSLFGRTAEVTYLSGSFVLCKRLATF